MAQPVGWFLFRILVGGWLLIEGWPKIMHPMSQVQFIEMIGFHPGWLFSPLLAITQVIGGAMIILGLLTRPFAFANAIMLCVTLWFHLNFPYNSSLLLTSAGIDAIKIHPEYFTPNGVKRLADGGLIFIDILQTKAIQLSSFWAVGCLFFSAFGGGYASIDNRYLKKQI